MQNGANTVKQFVARNNQTECLPKLGVVLELSLFGMCR
ncbi:hypothetical protein RUA4292_00255 [Ruegeria atlantica]|uniref:Uncharacterized protein n=1 Tax=Ruegeria atlantica TaxID=81569 RepID=A0A0P1E9Y9_9RHOB|nr:hypothetical protein RUA4292_00255 [Ruegeria atlantica]